MKGFESEEQRAFWNEDWSITFRSWDLRDAMHFDDDVYPYRGAFWMFMWNVLTAVALAAEYQRGQNVERENRYESDASEDR